mmetsp:Transcript_17523/g.36031  ORF Transcript_17523/g.36031 Transcript_17523/m.36031 type:complete len:234 (-) Transcript_17523:216-917(-)|eukprot:CAMPEP_0201253656 /NCGR_PEP_ID=MMETSP0852-20130820/67560_1 /ASSEMBLY_ACC=CAM_ASM_000632 /TAXON_ID=183588 /ORGANISM="Pseudo-nitzschia fraudulenta, Strain WWA7" /LENGTH=233 /DNA_ID=CAMNT_0047553447 /DNA_START=25 /DNA_END=726 /DNA_ORIENTATION=-
MTDKQQHPRPAAILFDCDDCLYFDDFIIANQQLNKIQDWCTKKYNQSLEEQYRLYSTYGTQLKGLLEEGIMERSEESIDEYLRVVHDVDIEASVKTDSKLREILLSIDPSIPKYVFTAGVKHHAERCVRALGIDDLFVDIIDVKRCSMARKHSKEAFKVALKVVGVEDPGSVLFFDDSLKNIEGGNSMGIRSFLVGKVGHPKDGKTAKTSEHAEKVLESIHDLPTAVPEIFEF